jgi:hypothetical protein
MVDGLWVGGTRGDTDFHALAYQIKLLGFNAVRLPFTFSQLKLPGKRQAMECAASTKSAWARRATDPTLSPKPEYSVAPDPPLFMEVAEWDRDMCNTYVPSNETALAGERLLWAVQYFIASGFYVVVSNHGQQAWVFALSRECWQLPVLAPSRPDGDLASFRRPWHAFRITPRNHQEIQLVMSKVHHTTDQSTERQLQNPTQANPSSTHLQPHLLLAAGLPSPAL